MILGHRLSILLAAFALGLIAPSCTHAEDIDIFSARNGPNELPNVLILWDNSANWSSSINVPNCSFSDGSGGPKVSSPGKEQGYKMAIEKCAIYNVIDALPINADGSAAFNVGLMMMNANGGYPRQQFVPLTAANKAAFKDVIRNIRIVDDKTNNAPFGVALHEAFLMFSKSAPLYGTMQCPPCDLAAVSGGKYVGPPGSGCGANHIILLANGSPQGDGAAYALLAADGGNTTQIGYPQSYITKSDQDDFTDEFARFLRNADVSPNAGTQAIVTHGVAVIGGSSDGLYPNFIKAIAQQGGGQYYGAANINDLIAALLNIFNSIQASNTAFASASLPISTNTSGAYDNQVFVGMFRPDAAARPRWFGNLKQYQIIFDPVTQSLALGDALGVPALSSSTGFFRPSAVSYWTTASDFWKASPSGTPPTASDSPDGEVVEKGAIGQKLRTKYATTRSTREVYTCLGCANGAVLSGNAGARFAASNAGITTAMLGAADDTERASIINWVLGDDNAGDELGPGGTTTVRPSIHGDVLHSRPTIVNYGGTIGNVVFYGSNDGMLHAIDGNRTGVTPGAELWAFVPSEFLPRFRRMRNNLPEIRFPATAPGGTAVPRDYFVDGSITVYEKRDATKAIERAILYVTMRRGGRFLYAFDVTNPTAPKMLWRKSSSTLPVLGQTWSDARVARIRGSSNPVLVMGAGYDAAAEDAVPPAATTMGNAVVVLDAFDGTLLRTLSTLRSVAAPVTLLDTDYDGFTDRAYAADLGGNVYRVDFETSLGAYGPDDWVINKFASLGTRKFFYAADIVQTQLFTAVMLGSGDRERPLLQTTADRFYTLLDYNVGKGATTASTLTDASLMPVGGSFSLPSMPKGCYLDLDTHGEKVVTSAVSAGGYTYFSTNKPTFVAPDVCTANLGIAQSYRIQLFCGEFESVAIEGGGLPPSPLMGTVELTVGPNETRQFEFLIGTPIAQGTQGVGVRSGLEIYRPGGTADPTRRRTYWFTSKAL
jgi:type IV pilus assembly protein PilY1